MPKSRVPRRLPVVAVRAVGIDAALVRRYVRVMDRGLAPPGRTPRPPLPRPWALYLPSLRDWLSPPDQATEPVSEA